MLRVRKDLSPNIISDDVSCPYLLESVDDMPSIYEFVLELLNVIGWVDKRNSLIFLGNGL
jgi:hypothetical protein